MLIIKAIAALLVLSALGGTAYLMKKYTGTITDMPGAMMERQRNLELALKKKAEKGGSLDNEPGEKAFQRAKELLASNSMSEAEEKLKYIVNFYPSAKCAVEARRVLGEINVDRLLDPNSKDGKKTIRVKAGDTYSRIVRNANTTMDSLVHLSKLMRSDSRSLRPGATLTVMPLDLRVVIDLHRETLSLWKGGEFVKEYPIQKYSYKSKKQKNQLKIDSIRGRYRGETCSSFSPHYRASEKILFLSDKSLAIRAFSEENKEDFGRGFLLSPEDMEELPLLVRPGNEVEIRN